MIEYTGLKDWTFADANTREYTHIYHDYPARMIPQIPSSIIEILNIKEGLGVLVKRDIIELESFLIDFNSTFSPLGPGKLFSLIPRSSSKVLPIPVSCFL